MEKLSNLSDQLQQRMRGVIVPFIRVVVGLLWLENASWKVPPNFTGSFRRYTESAVSHEVFGPYATWHWPCLAPSIEAVRRGEAALELARPYGFGLQKLAVRDVGPQHCGNLKGAR